MARHGRSKKKKKKKKKKKITGRHIEFVKDARMCARSYILQDMDVRIKVMWQGDGRARDRLSDEAMEVEDGDNPSIRVSCYPVWREAAIVGPYTRKRSDKPRISVSGLALWLGVSHRVGSDLSYWSITESGG
jgi:hypothetical protein